MAATTESVAAATPSLSQVVERGHRADGTEADVGLLGYESDGDAGELRGEDAAGVDALPAGGDEVERGLE